MKKIVISATGLYHPSYVITNEELVATFNRYVRNYNEQHAQLIQEGKLAAKQESSSEFIFKASGIKQRYVVEKTGILDPAIMHPIIIERVNSECSIQAEMAISAAQQALEKAHKKPEDIDAVIVACSNYQRPYPAIAIEVQQFLGIKGFAFDMNVACSSATFALQMASDLVRSQHARAVLTINPEICSAGLNYCDRDSHFIFGDAATACVIESAETCTDGNPFEILSSKLFTEFSNNIRSNFGYLNSMDPEKPIRQDTVFVQNGRQVFREIVPMVADFLAKHLAENHLSPSDVKCFWLHQANLNMNNLMMEKLINRQPSREEAPIILDEYANTASAGSIIAFHLHQNAVQKGEIGLISSFGAGYSIGSLIVKKL